MSARRAHQKSEVRKLAKQADRRREHTDKYAPQRVDNDDREMANRLNELLAHFNGEEAHHA